MNNKVTLPPISDIFTNKDPQRLGGLPHPHHHPLAAYSSAYPMVPLYSYQYVNAAAAGMPPIYTNGAPAYSLYGSGYTAQTINQPRMRASSALSPETNSPIGNNGRENAAGRRQLAVLPTSPASRSSELALASPEAGKSSLLQPQRSRTRNNLPKETTYILLKWLNDHLNHPYPNSFEKTQLMLTTGLNQQQLSNWFINARRRKIKVLRQKLKLASS